MGSFTKFTTNSSSCDVRKIIQSLNDFAISPRGHILKDISSMMKLSEETKKGPGGGGGGGDKKIK